LDLQFGMIGNITMDCSSERSTEGDFLNGLAKKRSHLITLQLTADLSGYDF
jgi:hypothetical protein